MCHVYAVLLGNTGEGRDGKTWGYIPWGKVTCIYDKPQQPKVLSCSYPSISCFDTQIQMLEKHPAVLSVHHDPSDQEKRIMEMIFRK